MVGLLASGAACAPSGADAGHDPSAPLELSAPNDIETFDPRYAVDAYSLRASRLVHAGLVRLDPDTLEPRPYLAESWSWVDALTLRIVLREGAHFHSGAPLTPRDVAATIAALLDPVVASRHLRVVEAIASVTDDGPHAVLIRLARPHATLLTDLEVPVLRADQAKAPPDDVGALDGLGPFAVSRATRGDVLLTPADDGVVPRPAHAVVIRTVHDDNARALRLLAGKSDVALNVLPLASTLDGREGLAVSDRPAAQLTYMVARADRGPLADARVRRAISLGVDRAEIVRTLFESRAQPTGTLIPRANWAHADLAPLPFDPVGARALLDAAVGEGHRVHATLLTSTDRFRVIVARAIAQGLADVGVDVDVVPLELGTMLARLNAGDFELGILSFPEFTEPNILRNLLHSSFAPPAGYNRARIHDDALDQLLEDGDRTRDPDARRAIYAQVEERVRAGTYLVPLWNEDQLVVTSARAAGFRLTAEGRWIGLASIP